MRQLKPKGEEEDEKKLNNLPSLSPDMERLEPAKCVTNITVIFVCAFMVNSTRGETS